MQSPRARNAFSRACAARTWPAPDVAESKRTRGLGFIGREFAEPRMASGSLALSYGELLEDAAAEPLQFAEARQVILEIVIQVLRAVSVELGSQDHVAQLYGMRKQCVFLEFLQGQARIVVIHGFPLRQTRMCRIHCTRLRTPRKRSARAGNRRGP